MTFKYVNRIKKIYFLYEGKTKSGKARYFFSSNDSGKGKAIENVPDGYEIYEHPENVQVFLRKKSPQIITDIEVNLVKKNVSSLKRSKRYLVDRKDHYITIYESNVEINNLENILDRFSINDLTNSETGGNKAIDIISHIADREYTAVMRFYLEDENNRQFAVERFCFRGYIDDWIHLGGPNNIKSLVEKYVDLLGTDQIFDSPCY